MAATSLEQLADQARQLADSLARIAEGDEEEDAGLATAARAYLKARRLREDLFAPGLFSDPAWDLLLDLFVSPVEGRKFCVSHASIAANVPQTTGLRWLDTLARQGLIVRQRDPCDGRRCFIELTPEARDKVAAWLRTAFCA